MFKRFKVLDLYFSDIDLNTTNEWVDVNKEIPKQENGIFKVKLSNDNVVSAYFCQDKCISLLKYTGLKPSYWFSKRWGEPIYDVTYWAR